MNSMHSVTQIYQYIKEERFKNRLNIIATKKNPGFFVN